MPDRIRTVHPDEFADFSRFLERCYRAPIGAFERGFPHLYRPDPAACACLHVLEHEGQIVSHVGLFPIAITVDNVSMIVGGIGGVGTAPEARGQGYMSRLLGHVIAVMRDAGYAASWLGGDRQRYNAFGWETAGLCYNVRFTPRSFGRTAIEAVPLREVYPWDALEMVRRLESHLPCRAGRPHLDLQLRKEGLRMWVAEDGYAVRHEHDWRGPSVVELASASGRETGMVRSLLHWDEKIQWRMSAWDRVRLARVLPAAAGWEARNEGMYRVISLHRLLVAARPALAARAAALRDFDICIRVQEHDRTDSVTLAVQGGDVEIVAGQHSARVLDLSSLAAARLLFGGPSAVDPRQVPPGLAALFPVPVHVPPLSDV